MHARATDEREGALAAAYAALAARHNAAGLTEHVDGSTRDFYSRPAQVLMANRFTDACLDTIPDPMLRALPLVGTVDQAVDCTDILQVPAVYRRLAGLYLS